MAVMLGGAISFVLPAHQVPSIELLSEGPCTGVMGQTISVFPGIGLENFTPVNSTVAIRGLGWTCTASSTTADASEFTESFTETGTRYSIEHCDLYFERFISFPYADYSSFNYTIGLDVEYGPIGVGFSVRFWGTPTIIQDSRVAETGDSLRLTLSVPLDDIAAQSPGTWCLTALVTIDIRTSSCASVLLSRLLGIAQSQYPLLPLAIDLESRNGDSISRYMHPWYGMENRFSVPAVNITRLTDPICGGLIFPAQPNETIYVQPGRYSCVSGFYSELGGLSGPSFDFEIGNNEQALLRCRLDMIRVSLDINPVFIIDSLSVGPGYDAYYSFVDLTPPYPEALYVPSCNTTLTASLRYTAGLIGFGRYLAAQITTNGTENFILRVRLPYFTIFGVNLSPGELIVIVFVIGLLLGSLLLAQQPSTPRTRSRITHDPRFWPVVLLCLSVVFPWFSQSYIVSSLLWQVPTTATLDFMIPLSIMLRRATGVPGQPIYDSFIWLNIPVLFFVFWGPLGWAMSRIAGPHARTAELGYVVSILLPATVGLVFWISYPSPLTPQFGLFLVAIAPLVYIVGLLICRHAIRLK